MAEEHSEKTINKPGKYVHKEAGVSLVAKTTASADAYVRMGYELEVEEEATSATAPKEETKTNTKKDK